MSDKDNGDIRDIRRDIYLRQKIYFFIILKMYSYI